MKRALLVVYALVLIAIVVVANLGGTMEIFGFVAWVPYGDKLGHFVLMGVIRLKSTLIWRIKS